MNTTMKLTLYAILFQLLNTEHSSNDHVVERMRAVGATDEEIKLVSGWDPL